VRLLVPILVALVLVPALAGAGGPRAAPRVGAHRGGALLWPENSLLAYRNALALGVDALETDVHLSADGEVIVIHDPTLDRTTTGRGAVARVRLADLASLRLTGLDGSPTDEPVPTLAQLLDAIAPTRADLLLEIKVGADQQRYPGIEEKVLELVRSRGLASRVWLMAFEPETVRRLRDLDPAACTALLVARGRVMREGVAPVATIPWAVGLGASALGLDHRLIDAGVIAAAHAANLALAAWTVNAEPDLKRMVDLGVDVVISDRPDLALRAVGR
jgi:glycerophosphoryl diester phosphodiesterase